MFGRFMPTEGQFFKYFNDHAQHIVEGSKALVALLENFDLLEEQARILDEHERAADEQVGLKLERRGGVVEGDGAVHGGGRVAQHLL